MKNVLAIIFSVCALSTWAQDKLHLTGKISGVGPNAKVALAVGKDQVESELRNGVLSIEAQLLNAPALVYLLVLDGDEVKYTPFYVGNESVVIDDSIANFPDNVQAHNSKYDGMRFEAYKQTKELNQQIATLQKEVSELEAQGLPKDSLYQVYYNSYQPFGKITQLENSLKSKVYDFVKTNIKTPYAQYLLEYNFSAFSFNQFAELAPNLPQEYAKSKVGAFIYAIGAYPALNTGEKYHDFTATDSKGNTVQFSDFFTGKYVLLDFASPECGSCINAVPIVKALEQELKDKLVVVNYSIENTPQLIEEHVKLVGEEANLIWDADGLISTIIAKYRQQSTPYYLLFDPKGNLVKTFYGTPGHNFSNTLKVLMR